MNLNSAGWPLAERAVTFYLFRAAKHCMLNSGRAGAYQLAEKAKVRVHVNTFGPENSKAYVNHEPLRRNHADYSPPAAKLALLWRVVSHARKG